MKRVDSPWLSILRSISSPRSSTSSSAERTRITKSATRAASKQAVRSRFRGMYWSFCLNRSTETRKAPSETSASISRLPFRLRIAEAASQSWQSGTTTTFLGAPSLPENRDVSLWCSLCFSSCLCLAWFRRSNFDMTCWWGVLRSPFSVGSLPVTK